VKLTDSSTLPDVENGLLALELWFTSFEKGGYSFLVVDSVEHNSLGCRFGAHCLFQGTIVPDAVTALGSAAATSVVLAAALVAWRRRVGADRYAVDELLPDGRELRALGVLLAAMYVGYGAALRPEFLPGVAPQAAVWVLYLVVGSLLVLRLRRDRRSAAPTTAGRAVPLRSVAPFVAVYVLAIGAGSLLLRPVAPAAFVVLYLIAFAVGAATLTWIVRGLWRSRDAAA
jgi:hypothetical protein